RKYRCGRRLAGTLVGVQDGDRLAADENRHREGFPIRWQPGEFGCVKLATRRDWTTRAERFGDDVWFGQRRFDRRHIGRSVKSGQARGTKLAGRADNEERGTCGGAAGAVNEAIEYLGQRARAIDGLCGVPDVLARRTRRNDKTAFRLGNSLG